MRRYRVPYKVGQFVVVFDQWNGELVELSQATRDGYCYAITGRRSVDVFWEYADAEQHAESCVSNEIEEFGGEI